MYVYLPNLYCNRHEWSVFHAKLPGNTKFRRFEVIFKRVELRHSTRIGICSQSAVTVLSTDSEAWPQKGRRLRLLSRSACAAAPTRYTTLVHRFHDFPLPMRWHGLPLLTILGHYLPLESCTTLCV